MSNAMRIALATVALVAVIAVSVFAFVNSAVVPPLEPEKVVMSPALQGYPPPTPTFVSPTPTPVPDMDGYFPEPTSITTTITTIQQSPYSDLLVPLQAAFEHGDAAWIVSLAAGSTNDIGFVPLAAFGGHHGWSVEPPMAESMLNSLFVQGSTPLIQGYFVEELDFGAPVPCLIVISHPWQGQVTPPTAIPGGMGAIAPSQVALDAVSFDICKATVDSWEWGDWRYGGYHGIVTAYPDNNFDLQTYFVVRPE